MLIPEARWLRQKFAKLKDEELFPLLNVGSQTRLFREVDQPWIQQLIFRPLAKRKGAVVHTDMQSGDGVDIVGDLTDMNFVGQLRKRRFRSVLCSNLLEHVPDRYQLASILTEIVVPGGYLIVTVPNSYPYHPDPIDTLYRPDVPELVSLFPVADLVDGAVVSCGTYAWFLATRELWQPGALIRAVLSPRQYHPEATKVESSRTGRLFPWLFRNFRATCIVMRRK